MDMEMSVRTSLKLIISLKELEIDLGTDFLVHLAVASLPPSLETFKVNYNAQEKKWTVNELIAYYVMEEERQKQGKAESANLAYHGANKKNFKRNGMKRNFNKNNGANQVTTGKKNGTDQASMSTSERKEDNPKTLEEIECYFCHKTDILRKIALSTKNG